MHEPTQMDDAERNTLMTKASLFPDEAYDFVRAGLAQTCERMHGKTDLPADESRHVSGQELCKGLRDLAIDRYGLLAKTVLYQWGIRRTDDFGTIVYALIERGELRSSHEDSLADFRDVFDFQQAFPEPSLN